MTENKETIFTGSSHLKKLDREQVRLFKKVISTAGKLTDDEKLCCASELTLLDLKKIDTLSPTCAELKSLIDEIDNFLAKLVTQSENSETAEEYAWVCNSATRWENTLLESLNVTRTVFLKDASPTILPALSQGDALSEDELNLRVSSLAKVVHAYRLRKEKFDGDKEQLVNDNWYRAETFLANDILDGTIDFAHRISSLSYWRLEKTWMAEVRELLAYLDWESDGGDLFDTNTEHHYFKAWEDFNQRIRSAKIKATASDFGEAKRYLLDRYVTYSNGKYKIDSKKIEKAGDDSIIHIKSRKVKEQAGKLDSNRYWDNDKNWLNADDYVKEYYENIIPAVMNGDKKCAQAVINAFDYSMRGPYRIINTFEMALAIYFISTDTLKHVTIPEMNYI